EVEWEFRTARAVLRGDPLPPRPVNSLFPASNSAPSFSAPAPEPPPAATSVCPSPAAGEPPELPEPAAGAQPSPEPELPESAAGVQPPEAELPESAAGVQPPEPELPESAAGVQPPEPPESAPSEPPESAPSELPESAPSELPESAPSELPESAPSELPESAPLNPQKLLNVFIHGRQKTQSVEPHTQNILRLPANCDGFTEISSVLCVSVFGPRRGERGALITDEVEFTVLSLGSLGSAFIDELI
ncbi:predicted GPI-anchored protein 58, partial [Poecilia latipinna]|uniref:predicted GPI-anchored protein 58 n=1 Tax=Poecilia latipinna TaxID=48699 RepID=UPI00072DFDCD